MGLPLFRAVHPTERLSDSPNELATPRPSLQSWQGQLSAAVRTTAALERHLTLTDDERAALAQLDAQGGLPLGITPHFLSLLHDDPSCPLRLQVVPRAIELAPTSWDRRDPLGEEDHEVVPFLVHRYPDRVLLLATDRCASYCRFCTRKRMVGQGPTPNQDHLTQALAYITAHDEIREVIVSGGDALLLSDERLGALLGRIRAIAHVDIIRLATRMLAFAPMRVTDALLDVIRPHHPLYVLSHFNHPRELAPEARAAITKLVDAGVPVLNQTVLLRGVNDERATLVELFRAITRLRARPYYLHQCDLAPGTDHFRVPLERALELVGSLRGHLSGLSIPTFVVDIPGGFGKAPLHPSPIIGGDDEHVLLQGFAGEVARYPRR